jgi:hypothetical protein
MQQKLTLLAIGLLFVALVAQRVWRSAELPANRPESAMPLPVSEEEERELYLTPGGRYTLADIEANGRAVPSRQYRGFRARHDFRPLPGDVLCPVTRTKANSACTWIVDGREYEFCCPPCIDEFVRLAKERPKDLEPPDTYIQR